MFDWRVVVAVAVVIATALCYTFGSPPKKKKAYHVEKDEAEPSTWLYLYAFSGYIDWCLRGVVLDLCERMLNLLLWRREEVHARRAGPPLWSGFQAFFIKRLYGRIEGC